MYISKGILFVFHSLNIATLIFLYYWYYLAHLLSYMFWILCVLYKDPLEIVRNKCVEAENCLSTQERLEGCETRVGSRSSTQEDCTEELFDFLHARDHCVRMTFDNFAGEECVIIHPQGLAEAFFKIEEKVLITAAPCHNYSLFSVDFI